MSKALSVESRIDVKGKIRPIRFEWDGQSYQIDSIGRRWKDKRGEHILVMIQPGNRVLELLYAQDADGWEILKGVEKLKGKRI